MPSSGLTRSVALETATLGIRINAVCPGPTDTRMQRTIEESMGGGYATAHAAVMQLIPMRRYATAEEIAAVVLFLASDEASSMTGSAVSADCGTVAPMVGGMLFEATATLLAPPTVPIADLQAVLEELANELMVDISLSAE